MLWVHLRAPASINRVESNGGRLLTPVLAVNRHMNMHAFIPAPTHANTLAHIPHTHMHGQNFSTDSQTPQHSAFVTAIILFFLSSSHPSTPSNSSEDRVYWLEGGLGLWSGISWKLNKKLKASEDITQRHASNMGHAEDTRVIPANLATGLHICSSHHAPARFPFLIVRLCKWDRLS